MPPTTMSQGLAWAPLIAAVTHIFEEFVLPGGFLPWYRRYRGDNASVTPRFLVIINVVLLAVCLNVAITAREPEAAPYWLGLVFLLCSNGVWHVYAAMRSHSYSPGMVTGFLLYIPLSIYGLTYLLYSGAVSAVGASLAVLAGGSYPLWSAVFHRKRMGFNG